jgi:hypothetical protein
MPLNLPMPMNPMTKAETYTVVVQPINAPGTAPAVVRLRRWLKSGLRGYGLRCTSVVQGDDQQLRVASDFVEPPAAQPAPAWPRPEAWELPDGTPPHGDPPHDRFSDTHPA